MVSELVSDDIEKRSRPAIDSKAAEATDASSSSAVQGIAGDNRTDVVMGAPSDSEPVGRQQTSCLFVAKKKYFR